MPSAQAKGKGFGGLYSHSTYHLTFYPASYQGLIYGNYLLTVWHSHPLTLVVMTYFAFLLLTVWPMVALSFPDGYLLHTREPLITRAPRIEDHPLFARGDVSTCGFVSGDVNIITTYLPHELLLHVYGTRLNRMGLLRPDPVRRQLPHLRELWCSALRWSG